jgi:hypothetical protein
MRPAPRVYPIGLHLHKADVTQGLFPRGPLPLWASIPLCNLRHRGYGWCVFPPPVCRSGGE